MSLSLSSALAGVSLILGKFLKNLKSGCKFFFLRGDFFFHHQGAKKQCFVAFPSQSQAVVGDIQKNGQTFSDLNFHKI